MTPNEHHYPEGAEELPTTELYPFSSPPGDEPAADDAMPDVPAMEQLPNPDALPDPGFPVMPAMAPATSAFGPPPPEPPRQYPGPDGLPWPRGTADGPSAQSWPRPPAWPAAAPSFRPAAEAAVAAGAPGPSEASRSPGPEAAPPPSGADHRQVWSPDPYAAPRAPDDAPPLRGPSVPWAEVRAAADHEVAGDPLAAPPTLLRAHPADRPPAEALLVEAPPSEPPLTEASLTEAPLTEAPMTEAPSSQAPFSPAPAGGARPGELARRPTSEALTSDMLLPGKRATPDAGWRRTVFRATGGLVRVGESPANLRHRELVNRIRTPVAGGHQRIAVLSLKGGVGKTTVTVGLGSTLASLRGDRVIAVDGNPDRGTLSDKVRLETTATIRDLLNDRAMVGRYADVRAFTSQASSRLEILASDRDPGVSVAFSSDDYRAVVGVLEHYYSICITDCGTGLLHSAMAGILELADQIVLVSSPSVDGARSASATLDWLEAHEYSDLVRGGVVVLSAVRRKTKSTVDLGRLEQHFAARCRAVVRVPYDTHLEEGAEFVLDYLDTETADAYLTLAALVADGFPAPRRSAASATPGFPLP